MVGVVSENIAQGPAVVHTRPADGQGFIANGESAADAGVSTESKLCTTRNGCASRSATQSTAIG